MRACKKNVPVSGYFATLLLLLLLSIPLQAATVTLGNFENSMDGWNIGGGATTAYSTQGVTLGASSLQVTFPTGWQQILSKDMGGQLTTLQTMTSFSLNVTTRNDAGQIPSWLGFVLVINSGSTGWQSFDLAYPGIPTSPRTDTLTVAIPQSIRDAFQGGTGGYAEIGIVANSGGGGIAWFDNINVTIPDLGNPTITVNAASPIRTIPMTLYGANLASWDGSMDGSNTTFNDLMKATGSKYYRIPGGSWGNGVLWSDIHEVNNPNDAIKWWRVDYTEYLNLMGQLSQSGETIHPTLQPIVNFPGCWYLYQDAQGVWQTDCSHGHQAAVNQAVAWVQDQTARATCAQYWEIGNEIGGPWELGYFSTISGTYYGDYYADFYLAMKAANPNIKLGACAEPKHELQPYGWYQGYWTYDLLQAAKAKNVVPDYLIIHSYQNGGGDGSAANNPTLLGSQINDIALWTSNLNSIVQNAIGAQYVGQIEYGLTEWNTTGYDPDGTVNDYDRPSCYVNAMFRAQYILEMARNKWTVSNPWIYDYDGSYNVFPAWYVKPLLINYFGRDMVAASSTNALVRAYAAKDAGGNLTIFMVNNSPTSSVTANVNISGFTAGTSGQRWLTEPAGTIINGGINIQDKGDISINGVVHPNPLTVATSLTPQSFTSGNSFSIALPASGMLLLKIPSAGDTTPPSAPTGLTATAGNGTVALNWNDNSEGDLANYRVYRATTSGGYGSALATGLTSSVYTDNSVTNGTTYYYVVTAVDTSSNESADSAEVSATPTAPCSPTTITPYTQIDSGAWVQTANATVNVGQQVMFGPQPVSGGSWSWSGPNGYSAATREITLSNIQTSQAGTYTATYTNTCGAQSQQAHIITVNASTSAPTFVAAGSAASGTGTITPALPSGIASGDILLLFVETANQAVSISNANGGTWTAVTNQGTGTAGSTTATRLTAFWSRHNGTQGAPTVSDSGDHQLGRMIAIRGAVTSGNPWNVTAGGVESTSDTSGSIAGATTTVANTLVVTAIATSLPDSTSTTRFSAWTNSNLTSLTERTDNSVTAGNGGGLGIATGVKATAGAYGNTAVTLATSAAKGMISIAIRN